MNPECPLPSYLQRRILSLGLELPIPDGHTTPMLRREESATMRAARRQLARSSRLIAASAQVTARGAGDAGPSTVEVRVRFTDRCLACDSELPAGVYASYWPGVGVTCRGCTLPA